VTTTSAATSGRRSFAVDLKYRVPPKSVASWVGLAAVVALALIIQSATFSPFSLQLITAISGCLLIAALGQNLVVMVGAIDLSVPAVMTLAAGLHVHLVDEMPSATSTVLIVVVCAVVGAVNGALVSFLRLNALIVTFATNAIISAALAIWLGQQYSTSGKTAEWLHSFATDTWLNVSALFWVALVLAVLVAGFLAHTRPGRRVAAVGANRQAALMLGARVNLITTLTFAAAGTLYGVTGLLAAGQVGSPNPNLGEAYQLATITVVAIAGTAFTGGGSSIASLMASVLLLQTLGQLLTLEQLNAGTLNVVQGALLIAAVSLNTWMQLGSQGFARLRRRFGTFRISD
jgi:ribose transport system permease protein